MQDRADVTHVVEALRASGWTVTVRAWTERQHRYQDKLGRWRWRAGYIEAPI